MGRYVNPDSTGFARILSGEYVDKAGILPIKKHGRHPRVAVWHRE